MLPLSHYSPQVLVYRPVFPDSLSFDIDRPSTLWKKPYHQNQQTRQHHLSSNLHSHSQAAWALGSLLGPILGGAFAQKTTWRWVFYLMFPFCFLGFATIPFVLTLKPKAETLGTKLKRVDWLGGALFVASMTSFLIAISWGGVQEPWGSWRTIVPLLLGAFGLVLTGLWESYRAKEPFLRRSLFHCPSAFAAYLGAFIQGLLVSPMSSSFLQTPLTSLALRMPLLRPSLLHCRPTYHLPHSWCEHAPAGPRSCSNLNHRRCNNHTLEPFPLGSLVRLAHRHNLHRTGRHLGRQHTSWCMDTNHDHRRNRPRSHPKRTKLRNTSHRSSTR